MSSSIPVTKFPQVLGNHIQVEPHEPLGLCSCDCKHNIKNNSYPLGSAEENVVKGNININLLAA